MAFAVLQLHLSEALFLCVGHIDFSNEGRTFRFTAIHSKLKRSSLHLKPGLTAPVSQLGIEFTLLFISESKLKHWIILSKQVLKHTRRY